MKSNFCKIFIITFFILFLPLKSFASNDINVIFAIDKKYPIFMANVIHSILLNNHSNSHYNFYVLEKNVSIFDKYKITKFVKKNNQNIIFIKFDDTLNNNFNTPYFDLEHISSIAMARIFIPNILPTKIEKILYLDSDIIVTDDLKKLYDIDIKNYAFAMGLDNLDKHKQTLPKKLQEKKYYYNSGVILMNLKKCREEKITEKLLNSYNQNIDDFINYYRYTDQDLINLTLNEEIYLLPQNWNFSDIRSAKYNDITGIIHYVGPKKPWDYYSKNNKYLKIYYKYWKTSIYSNYRCYYYIKSIKEKFAMKSYSFKIFYKDILPNYYFKNFNFS